MTDVAVPLSVEAGDRPTASLRYSICTLVNRRDDYAAMRASFARQGFLGPDVEYLFVDNCDGNRLDAYQACNLFLDVAQGAHVVICHQDVRLMDDGRERLDAVIAELDALDARWAVFGNCGYAASGRPAVRISDPHGENQSRGPFPARVVSLDENFIVVRRSANLAVSHDMTGFHLYATDLCVIADILGRTAYVADFHLRHLSGGSRSDALENARRQMASKYARAFRPRWVTTPSSRFWLTGSAAGSRLANSRLARAARRRLERLAAS